MENGAGSDHRSPLMAELARALALVRQLESHLDHLSPTDSCKSLAPKILSSIQNSILMAKSSDPDGIGGSLASDSPRSENSSPSFKDHGSKEMMKKRKKLHKWTKQVRLIPGARAKDPEDDGYSWRKYGQKDILGTKHPRAYYRCTHRITQGCPATKQVQRSDEDPQLFDITYHGAHTCLQKPQRSSTSGCQQKQHKAVSSRGANERLQQQQNQNLLLSSQAGLKVKPEGLDSEEAQGQASLSFGSMAARGDVFSSLSTNDRLIGSSSPTFLSPVTSESTYFSMSPYRFDGVMKLQTSDSDLTEIISRANSASNSSLADMDFTLDELDFDQDFQFDASSFFFP